MLLQLGIFLVTLSGLVFEIALTRIFSAGLWYHFAFVAISVALLGWGLGGFAVHLLKKVATPTLDRAALVTALYGASIPLALWLILKDPLHPDRLSFYFAVTVAPFFLAGMALSIVFDLYRHDAGRLYFADLLGAALGALGVTLLLAWLGGEATVLVAALAPFAAAACLSRRVAPLAAVGLLATGGLLVQHRSAGLFRVHGAVTKGMYRHMAEDPKLKIDLTGWNSYSRIDVVRGFPPPFLGRFYIDSDAWTNIHYWDGTVESLDYMKPWYRALPFKLAPKAKTLVIGPGGGADVLVALASGAESVTAAEMNPLILEFVRHYGAEAGNLYDHPRVEAILTEGRNFVARTDRRFDVIFLGFVDSWAAVASGGLSLSENYLYTTEAFKDYVDHLTDRGMLVIMRWDPDVPRLVTNSVALLGAEEAGKRMAVLMENTGHGEDPPQMTFILKKAPFTEAEKAEVRSWGGRRVVFPGDAEEPYASLLSGRKTLEAFAAEANARVDPVFDDRPFFFARQKPWGPPPQMMKAFREILLPIFALLVLFAAFGKPKGEPFAPFAGSVAYFSSLGLGFIAVELALLQHLTLLLGHPIFTLSVLLFTLLAASGAGSRVSARFAPSRACALVAGLGGLYAIALPAVVPMLLPLPLSARLALAVVLVAPLGFVMGVPFPRGLSLVGHGPFAAPPFYWGLNGVLSVAGSVGTVLVALTLGFRAAMLAGCACYAVAALAAPVLERRAARPEPTELQATA